jgi:V/A-type H+-transporting ATPase subunit C
MADYAYSNTRIRVMKSLLLGNSDFEVLLRAKNLNNCLTSLKQTAYGGALTRLERVTIHEIERILDTELTRTIGKVIRMSSHRCAPLLAVISEKYQFEYIKRILDAKMGDLPPEEIRDMVPAVGEYSFLSRLIDLPVRDIKDLLCDRYEDLDEFMPESPGSLETFVALDRYYFSELQNALKNLGGRDRKVASRIVSMEVDIANIMIIIRSITRRYDSSKFIIPGDDSNITDLVEHMPKDVMGVIEKLSRTHYGPLLEDAVSDYAETKSLVRLELTLKRYLAGENKVLTEGDTFQLGYILAFLKLKELEIGNLRAICVGVNEGLSPDRIRELLIMPT